VPEEWAKYLQGVGEGVTQLSSVMDANLNRVSQESRLNTERIENMTKTYMELQEVLDEKDKEIARFKDGYDAEIFRRFIGRFARVDQALEDLILDGGESEELSLIKRLLEDAFEECGVEKTSPNIGEDYRTVSGVSDNPKIQHTNDPSLEFQIVEVIECGYELNTSVERKSIIPSKVKIYKYVEEAQ
jgi:molecular chaperone GrpE (heat shock protein)